MTDEADRAADSTNSADAAKRGDAADAAAVAANARREYAQRNFAGRLFPGPSKQMSEQYAQHLERLLKQQGGGEAVNRWRERADRAPAGGDGAVQTRPTRPSRPPLPDDEAPPAIEAPTGAPTTPPVDAPGASDALYAPSPEDVAALRETLDKQNELLQAILSTSLDTQTDARSTAQNSRTFAWAGTAIALLTLVATVISIVAAVRAG